MRSFIMRLLRRSKVPNTVFRRLMLGYESSRLTALRPLQIRASRSESKRLNLILPSIRKHHVYGGISTILYFFSSILERYSGEYRFRIILTEYDPKDEDLAGFTDFKVVSSEEDTEDPLQIVPVNSRKNKTLPVGKNDFFIGTSWQTAYLAQRIFGQQKSLYGTSTNKLIYFIQDFEPGFYPFSSEYLLSLGTYQSNVPQIAIFNTSFLKDYFSRENLRFSHEYFFEPKLNAELKSHLAGLQTVKKKKQILIYGRPSVARNAFVLILDALRKWAETFTDADQWEVVSAGEQHGCLSLGSNLKLRSVGKLSLQEYAQILQESSVGLSLMVSPHPSYPPLEMAHFGILTLTNAFANKDLSSWHDNITSVSCPTIESLSAALADLCRKFEDDPSVGLGGQSRAGFYLDDSDPFEFIGEMVADLSGGGGEQ